MRTVGGIFVILSCVGISCNNKIVNHELSKWHEMKEDSEKGLVCDRGIGNWAAGVLRRLIGLFCLLLIDSRLLCLGDLSFILTSY